MFGILSLGAGVGDGEENREEDVSNLSKALEALDDDGVRDDGWSSNGFISKPLIDGVKRLQEGSDAKVDGNVRPKGETEQIINNKSFGKPPGAGLYRMPLAPLAESVGAAGDNREADVATVKRSLGALGFMPEDPFDAPNGFMTAKTDNAIRAFQNAKGLKQDGLLHADGPTQAALTRDVTRLSDKERAKWKKFHERVAAYNKQHDRKAFPAEEHGSGKDADGVVPAQARRALEETFRRLPPPAWPKTRPFKSDDWLYGSKYGPLPNVPNMIRGLFSDEKKPEPGRKPTVMPPAITKGVDPTKKRPLPSQTSKPAAAPKLPEKRDPGSLDDIRKGAIEIYPDQRERWSIPWIVENRLGDDNTIELNTKMADIFRGHGNLLFGRKFRQVGGPRPGSTKEHYIPNPENARRKPKSTKDSSYVDITYEITVERLDGKKTTVWVHIDTYTARKSDRGRVSREQKQFEKLGYNEENNAIFISVPKPHAGESLNFTKWSMWSWRILEEISKGLAAGEFDGPRRAHHIHKRFSKFLRD